MMCFISQLILVLIGVGRAHNAKLNVGEGGIKFGEGVFFIIHLQLC